MSKHKCIDKYQKLEWAIWSVEILFTYEFGAKQTFL